MARSLSSFFSFLTVLLFVSFAYSSALPPSARSLGTVIPSIETTERDVTPYNELLKRTTCRAITVNSGDGCDALATRCKITPAQLSKYNKEANFCGSLVPGEEVCCSPGKLPNLGPKPKPNGDCAPYTIQSGDSCAAIAGANHITPAKITKFNQKTWAWNGCARLLIGQKICLSTGTAPMPAAIAGAECGPQVPGTAKPAAGVNLATLNPCPLNACCDASGQCGTTPFYCVNTHVSAPGSWQLNTNGCISNCGTGIISATTPTNPFRRVAYFQGGNLDRPCVNMDVSQINTTEYTHILFAFATLSHSFDVLIPGDAYTQFEFNQFKNVTGPKRILSIGGYDFSTDPSTYMIFRNGVKPANSITMAENIATFVNANGLDGVDIDWEYPGAIGTPGIPDGSPQDGTNFLDTLVRLKNLLGDKQVSFTAPASYYYLKAFPIAQMSEVVDFVNYMTYDLSDADPTDGCPTGRCLRSSVNSTVIDYAMSMITKAGASSGKIVPGVVSYGTSFQMSKAGCTGPTCGYTGAGAPGPCTVASGTLANAEISQIIATNPNIKQIDDVASNTNILVYNNTQWVSYMTDANKNGRISHLQSINFGGALDWSVDLESFLPSPAFPKHPKAKWQSDWDTFKAAIAAGTNPFEK